MAAVTAKPELEKVHVTKLLEHEASEAYLELQDALMLTTFYTVTGNDSVHTLQRLYERMKAIFEANKWLMSRVRKISGPGKPLIQLEREDKISDPSDYVSFVTDDEVFSAYEQTYSTLGKTIWKYAVKEGKCILGISGDAEKPGSPLAHFSILQDSTRTKVCVIIASNHLITDGGTLYTLYKMFDLKEPVLELTAERVKNYDQLINENTSLAPLDKHGERIPNGRYFESLMTTAMPVLMCNAVGNLFRGVKPTGYCYLVDQEKIAETKEKFNKDGNFVSTNDVLTAWLAGLFGSTIDNVVMPVNLRFRIPEIEHNRAGTYLGFPPFRAHQMESPQKVREALQNFAKPGYSWTAPSMFEYFKSGVYGHTNWVRFYHEVELEGLQQVIHMPMFNVPAVRVGPLQINFNVFLITFVPNKGELAVMVQSLDRRITLDLLSEQTILKNKLMDV